MFTRQSAFEVFETFPRALYGFRFDLPMKWAQLEMAIGIPATTLTDESLCNVTSVFLRSGFCLQHPSAGWSTCEFAWEDHCKTHLIGLQANCDLARRYGTIVAGITCPIQLLTVQGSLLLKVSSMFIWAVLIRVALSSAAHITLCSLNTTLGG